MPKYTFFLRGNQYFWYVYREEHWTPEGVARATASAEESACYQHYVDPDMLWGGDENELLYCQKEALPWIGTQVLLPTDARYLARLDYAATFVYEGTYETPKDMAYTILNGKLKHQFLRRSYGDILVYERGVDLYADEIPWCFHLGEYGPQDTDESARLTYGLDRMVPVDLRYWKHTRWRNDWMGM